MTNDFVGAPMGCTFRQYTPVTENRIDLPLGGSDSFSVDLISIEEIIAPFWGTDDRRSAEERAEAYGIDLSLITENLRLRPEQRVMQNDFVLTEAEHLIAAHERAHPDHSTAR